VTKKTGKQPNQEQPCLPPRTSPDPSGHPPSFLIGRRSFRFPVRIKRTTTKTRKRIKETPNDGHCDPSFSTLGYATLRYRVNKTKIPL